MKALGMNKMLGTLKRRTTGLTSSADNSPEPRDESPEVTAANAVKQFCTSESKQGDEVLFLPTIVDAAESSPAAAAECARVIRKYLAKNYVLKPSHQYNAVMLVRILTDNPGPTFTRNLDKKFVEAVKNLLRGSKDHSVLNLLMETLDTFEYTKAGDEGLALLLEMWKKEKEKPLRNTGYRGLQRPPRQVGTPNLGAPSIGAQGSYFSSHGHSRNQLPDPAQLASRLEEASTSAKLLIQLVTSSTAQELLDADLVKEFASRCQSAHRSIQGYMAAEDPPPDNDTMESLLDTSEQVQDALNTHRRAVLSAKKSLGIEGAAGTPTGGAESPRVPTAAVAAGAAGAAGDDASGRGTGQTSSSRSTSHAPNGRDNGKGREEDAPPEPKGKGTAAAGGSSYDASPAPQLDWNQHPDDPFRDPLDDRGQQQQQQQAGGSSSLGGDAFAFETYHPGFSAAGGSGGSGAWKEREDDDIYDSGPRR